jgi:hypothetical protein
MEQHAIPQQISSYQFRLVGDMTLKQFFQVASGALISLLIYSTNLYPIIKWPLIIFSFAFGAALAFLPFEERPLSRWILAFFRSIYSPTLYFWKRSEEAYQFFQEEAVLPKEDIIIPHGEVVLEKYLHEISSPGLEFLSNLEGYEKSFLGKIKDIFASAITPIKPEFTEKPKQEATPIVQKPIEVPVSKPASIASKGFRPKIVIEEKPLKEEASKEKVLTSQVSPTLTESDVATQQAQFSLEAAPPNPPTIPNTVVGQVIDPAGKIVEGAILEIRDLAGRPVRALRSNKLGHFIIVTALQDGSYDIITEKEGLIFDPITFDANGEIIPPIAIKAKSIANTQPIISDANEQSMATI